MHDSFCDKMLLEPQDLCNFLSDLLLIFSMSLDDHDTLRAYRHAMELFVELMNLYFDQDVCHQI